MDTLITNNNSMSMVPWVEKYRPVHFDQIVLDPINRKLFENILEKNYFPNLLLFGPPGTGKTTTVINLINEYQKRYFKINKSLIIHLNASDERGIDIVRNQILSFVKTNNLFDKGLKFVILDEVDYMTKNAQQALKYLLQTCNNNNNVKFCLICNYISKIDESLKNEFICMRFNQLPKEDIFQFIRHISHAENIDLSERSIHTIQSIYQSDIRSMINFLQLNQNLKMEEWGKSVLHEEVLKSIHDHLKTQEKRKEINGLIHAISFQYNMDKRSILLSYFDYIIRRRPEYINKQFLDSISHILHNSNADIQTMLDSFTYQISESLY